VEGVRVSGPILTGVAGAIMTDLVTDITDRVAAFAIQEVQKNLDGSLKNPTPYYETQIQISNLGTDRIVNDRGVIYGSWLEGTGSRNQTTRFKGYASFRRARQATEAQVGRLVASALRIHLGRLG
jgi:hypothetical protein